MGACCSSEFHFGRAVVDDIIEKKENEKNEEEGDDDVAIVDYGARMRIHGHSKYISMYTQQGIKGVNQDDMTVWEDFTGHKDMVFCGVFDGHGPYGHKVARHLRNNLPSRLSSVIKATQLKLSSFKDGNTNVVEQNNGDDANKGEGGSHSSPVDDSGDTPLPLSLWESILLKSFNDMDDELSVDASIDSYCSGATAVTVVKKGNHLIIANLGDSRAVLCTKGNDNQLFPVQLTTDLKPNIPSEAERIKKCNGRVFALDEEPEVFRVWMPDEDCPGLAMARSFGDFCLKDYGLISIPEISYKRLTKNDEFVVLATDGVWDVLTNSEVIKIVASASNRSMAAKLLVKFAVQAWRSKYPRSKVDDCAVVCLFLKKQTTSFSELSLVSMNHTELAGDLSEVSHASIHRSEIAADPGKSIVIRQGEEPEECSSSQERMRSADPSVKRSRLNSFLVRQ